jgi:hypothetical protein
MKRFIALTVLSGVLLAAVVAFGAEPVPTTYSHVARNRFFGDLVVRVQRDGTRALVQLTSATDPTQMNIKNYYDLAAHRVYTVDLNSNLCSTIAYTSPYPPPLNDAVALTGDVTKQLADSHIQPKPGETIAGQPTQLYEMKSEGASMKTWVDQKYGIPMRQVMTPKDGQPITAMEVSEIHFTAPPAAIFTFPKNCQKLEGTTDANGGHAVMK